MLGEVHPAKTVPVARMANSKNERRDSDFPIDLGLFPDCTMGTLKLSQVNCNNIYGRKQLYFTTASQLRENK
jgi:hypothetical protein